MSETKKVTPVGPSTYPKVQTPDTKFKAEGQYQTTISYSRSNPKHAPFIEELIKDVAEAWAYEVERVKFASKGKTKLPAQPIHLPYKETEDGIDVRFKANATYKDKKTGETMNRKLKVTDRLGRVIEEDLSLGSGTQMRVKYTIKAYGETKETSVSLYMDSVQIAKAVKYEGDSFDALDDEYGDDEETTAGASESEAIADDGEDNF